ncbi:MAG: hypothetical protein WEB85_02825 [Dongiaceae bacterium]
MHVLRTGLFGALALLVLAPPPAAGQPFDAALNAIAYGPIAPGAAFQIWMTRDDELARRVRELVESELRGRGYAVADDAPLVLTIETEADGPDGPDEGSLGQFRADSDSGAEIRMNVWSSRDDSLLGPTPDRPRRARTFRITVAVHDQATGRYLWRGAIDGARDGSTNALSASEAAVPALVDAIGQTVDNPSVPLR